MLENLTSQKKEEQSAAAALGFLCVPCHFLEFCIWKCDPVTPPLHHTIATNTESPQHPHLTRTPGNVIRSSVTPLRHRFPSHLRYTFFQIKEDWLTVRFACCFVADSSPLLSPPLDRFRHSQQSHTSSRLDPQLELASYPHHLHFSTHLAPCRPPQHQPLLSSLSSHLARHRTTPLLPLPLATTPTLLSVPMVSP